MKRKARYYPAKYPEKVRFDTFLRIQQTENEQFIHTNFELYFKQLENIVERRQWFPAHVPLHLLPYASPFHLYGAAFHLSNSRQAWERAFVVFKQRYGAELRQISGGRTFMHRINTFLLMYSLHPLPLASYHVYYYTYGAVGKSISLTMRKMPLFVAIYSGRNVYGLTDLSLHYLSIFWSLIYEYQRKLV
jgi:hypothetical protein